MYIRYHGGKCCGIKTIEGFGYPACGQGPKSMISARDKEDDVDHDKAGQNPSKVDFFTDKTPKETMADRLDRMLAFLKKRRPYGVVEAILADGAAPFSNPDYDQHAIWHDTLIDRGFVCVTNCHNSNSGNRIYIYHKKFDKE